MNILIFGWRDPRHPLAGGAEQVVHEHAKGWIEAGHEVTLFSSRFDGSPKEEILDGVKIIRGGYQYLGVQIAAFFFYLKSKKKFDLIIDQFHGIPFFIPLYIKKPKIALIQEVARKVWFLNSFSWPFNWLVGLIGYFLEPFIFMLYKNIPFMTGSESAKIDVTKFGIDPDNVTVIPHGVILPKLKIKNKKSKIKTIIYLGILSRDKGIEDALECFSILNKTGGYQFWVVGRAENESYMKKIVAKANKLELEKCINFWGYVTNQKKFELLSESHILINPSVHEGWGLVNIEANIVGTPVVAYDSAGLTDSVKDGTSGVIIKDNTPSKLAIIITEILKNVDEYRRLQMGALVWSKNFSWGKSKKLSLDLLKSITIKETAV